MLHLFCLKMVEKEHFFQTVLTWIWEKFVSCWMPCLNFCPENISPHHLLIGELSPLEQGDKTGLWCTSQTEVGIEYFLEVSLLMKFCIKIRIYVGSLRKEGKAPLTESYWNSRCEHFVNICGIDMLRKAFKISKTTAVVCMWVERESMEDITG